MIALVQSPHTQFCSEIIEVCEDRTAGLGSLLEIVFFKLSQLRLSDVLPELEHCSRPRRGLKLCYPLQHASSSPGVTPGGRRP
jgi:hypothetical protein